MLNFIKNLLLDLKTQININPLTVISVHHCLIDKLSEQKINRSIRTDIKHQMCFTSIYSIFHSHTKEYTSTQQRMEAILKQATCWDIKQITNSKTEITSCILSDHNAIKLKLDTKQIARKYTNSRIFNNSLLHDEWIKEEIKKEIKVFPGTKWKGAQITSAT